MNTVIYLSKFHETAFLGIISRLKSVNPAAMEENHIVIVPDRFTLSIEKQLYSSLAGSGSFNINVLTLKRLASKFSAEKKYISSCGGVMLVKKAVKEIKTQLKCYEKSTHFSGFAESMYNEICRLKNSLITPEMLLSASQKAEGELKFRLEDIAAAYKKYTELTDGRYIDTAGYLRLIADNAQDSSYVKNSYFYFAGFDNLTSAEKECFKKIIIGCKDCCFALCDIGGSLEEIKTIIAGSGKNAEIVNIPDEKNPVFDYIYENIDGYGFKPCNIESNINLFSFSNTLEETENAAQLILEDIRHKNLRFKDISVILCSIKDYMYPLEKVFKKYNISYFISESEFLSSKPLFKAILSLLNCVCDNCNAVDVTAFVKSRFFNAETADTEVFENYCLKYGIDRSRFLQPFMLSDDKDNIAAAENVRLKFQKFYNMADKVPAKCSDIISVIKNIISQLNTADAINEFNTILQSNNYEDEAAYNKQVLEKINRLLEETEEILKDEIMSLSDFKDILVSGADTLKLSIVPVSADVITCGGVESARYNNPKSVYVLGALEGLFPPSVFAAGIISGSEVCKIPELCRIEGDIRQLLSREHLKIKRFLSCKTDSLCISYPFGDSSGRELKPSAYILRLKNLFGINITGSLKYNFKREAVKYENEVKELSNAKELFFNSGTTSISAIETYFSCPRKHFFNYGLFCKEREQTKLKSMDIGIFLHSAAEKFVKNYTKGADADSLAHQCFEQVASEEKYKRFFVRSAAYAVFLRLKNEIVRTGRALAYQIDNSDFKTEPKYLEAEFNKNGIFPPVELETEFKKVYLSGKIDRADVYYDGINKYIRVIDYKSGSIKYDEKQLYFGLKIQLFVYMKALYKSGYKAAGLYYFPIHDNFLKEEDNFYCLLGVTVNEKNIINASDKISGGQEGESNIIKLKLKNGENGFEPNVNLKDRDTFEKYLDYSVLLSEGAVKEILGGNVDASPAEKSCEYCEYKNVCAGKLKQSDIRKAALSETEKKIGEAVNGN